MKAPVVLFLSFLLAWPGFGRLDQATCGTHRDTWKEELHLHRKGAALRKRLLAAGAPRPARADIGHVAIVEDADGVVARRNEFDLDARALTFAPTIEGRYVFTLGGSTYDQSAATAGTPLSGLGDDDSRSVSLPFSFPFYGGSYRQVFVNSDGNLTFTTGDAATSERSLGRLVAGPPRIAGLFMDLDPSRAPNSVRVLAEASRFVVSWVAVPDFDFGFRQTVQVRLYPNGRIELAWSGVSTLGAVVGIAPGELRGSTSVVSFSAGNSAEYSAAVAERFGGSEEIDIATAAQKFYETHDDSYDYLVIYNNMGLAAASGAVAYESTVRNNRTGYGDPVVEIGREFGSANRLQAVLNMGPLTQYPRDPNEFVPARRTARDTPLTVLGHETGHLFLAFASIRDALGGRPMLGAQGAHWAFNFNSEASLLEGNRIRDNGAGAVPRFTTVAAAEGYAPLDQYLMGFRAPDEVPPTFLITGPGSGSATQQPQVGVNLNGTRQDISIDQVIAAEGRRVPDHNVAQRRFRFAFILVVPQATNPSQADIDQVETYRREFELFYFRVASERASADASLRLSLRLSAFPAVGLTVGRSGSATLTVQRPVDTALTIALRSQNGGVSLPSSVTIPAGSSSVSFAINGVREGVDEIAAEPSDTRYDSAWAKIDVADPRSLSLTIVSGNNQRGVAGAPLPEQVVVRVIGPNLLPYSGIPITATVAGRGIVSPAVTTSGPDGLVRFTWTPAEATERLELRFVGFPAASADVSLSALDIRLIHSVWNAASFINSLSPGTIASVFGASLTTGPAEAARTFPWPDTLAGAQILINGRAVPVLYAAGGQINFLIPSDTPAGNASFAVSAGGVTTTLAGGITIQNVSPGIFFNVSSALGAILVAGTTQSTPARGEVIEIYCTGLGRVADRRTLSTPRVTIGGIEARVLYSGLAPGYEGLYQVNVEVPGSAPSGAQEVNLSIDGAFSNAVKVGIR